MSIGDGEDDISINVHLKSTTPGLQFIPSVLWLKSVRQTQFEINIDRFLAMYRGPMGDRFGDCQQH